MKHIWYETTTEPRGFPYAREFRCSACGMSTCTGEGGDSQEKRESTCPVPSTRLQNERTNTR